MENTKISKDEKLWGIALALFGAGYLVGTGKTKTLLTKASSIGSVVGEILVSVLSESFSDMIDQRFGDTVRSKKTSAQSSGIRAL